MKHLWLMILLFFTSLALWNLPEGDKVETLNTKIPFYITIDGAVTFPKTLVFYEAVSLYEIIQYAGGYLENADMKQYQQTYYETNTSIFIPYKEAVVEEVIIKVNINKASFSELIQIPYMTETRAAELILYRTLHGEFNDIEELLKVKYIGQATLENLRPYITTSAN